MKDKADERLLGIDLGTVRTGFAVSDPGGFLASPIETVTERDLTRLADRAFPLPPDRGPPGWCWAIRATWTAPGERAPAGRRSSPRC